jgi:hypothetical protein
MGFDKVVDVGFQFCGGAMDAALQLSACKFCEPPLDLD